MTPTKNFQEYLEAYYLALGRFVDRFAQVEAAVFWALCATSQVPGLNAKAVFSGVRLEVACEHIRRIYEVNGQALPKVLERAFPQLKIILAVRNSVLHYGYMAYPDLNWITSNERTALPTKAKELPISPEIMNQMDQDLGTIAFSFGFHTAGFNPLPQEDMKRLETCALAPWQYKSPGQEKATKPDRQVRAKQSSPPEPFQE
jgi:hypothetical protein